MNVIERAEATIDRMQECECDECAVDATLITDLLSIVERLPKDAEGNVVVHGDRLIGPDGKSYMASGWSWVEPILIGTPKQLAVNCRRQNAAAVAAREGE